MKKMRIRGAPAGRPNIISTEDIPYNIPQCDSRRNSIREPNMQNNPPDGYLAEPATGGGNCVLVLHAWWGLNDTIRKFCDRLAENGYIAFAPDLYHSKLADTIEGAEALVNALDGSQAKADVAEAAAFLSGKTGRSLAVIGFSLGAYYAFDLSVVHPELVRAVVVFYGAGVGDFKRSRAAYLGHFAENDPYEDPDYIAYMEESIHKAGRPVTFYLYESVGHWFFEPDRTDAYDQEAADLAWQRTLTFLNEAFAVAQ